MPNPTPIVNGFVADDFDLGLEETPLQARQRQLGELAAADRAAEHLERSPETGHFPHDA